MNIIHITTDGMDAHQYRYIERNEIGLNLEPSSDAHNLDDEELIAILFLSERIYPPAERPLDYGEAFWRERAPYWSAVGAKYHFAKEQGLLENAENHLPPANPSRGVTRRLRKGVASGFSTLARGGSLTGMLATAVARSVRDATEETSGDESDRIVDLAMHAFSQFEYTLLSLDEARSCYREHEGLAEGIYMPHPASPNKLLPVTDFPTRSLRERLFELLHLLAEMGASKILLAEADNGGHGGKASATAGGLLDASLAGSYQRRSATEAEVHLEGGSGTVPPAGLLDHSTWFSNDDQLRFLLQRRRSENRLTYFRYKLETELRADVNIDIAAKVKGVDAKALAAYEGFRSRSLALEVTF